MNITKVHVIAGSHVDANMGVALLLEKGIAAHACPVAQTAPEYELLLQKPDKLRAKLVDIIQQSKQAGASAIFVYCNSLSAAIDMTRLAKDENISIITPLQVYETFANKYDTIAVLAGNNQGLAGIERAIARQNPACKVIGLAMLPLVIEIEKQTPAAEIVQKYALEEAFAFFQSLGIDTVILGCTHFPYLYDELIKMTKLNIVEPSQQMAELLFNLS